MTHRILPNKAITHTIRTRVINDAPRPFSHPRSLNKKKTTQHHSIGFTHCESTLWNERASGKTPLHPPLVRVGTEGTRNGRTPRPLWTIRQLRLLQPLSLFSSSIFIIIIVFIIIIFIIIISLNGEPLSFIESPAWRADLFEFSVCLVKGDYGRSGFFVLYNNMQYAIVEI